MTPVFRRIAFWLLLLIPGLVLLEVGLRLIGYRPHREVRTQLRAEPRPAFRYDANLGLRPNPGTFTVTINDSLTYGVSHLADGSRSTGSVSDSLRPETWILGCSFAYGMGVNDDETFAARLQAEKPDIRVRNFGVPAYGTVHGWLQLQTELAKGQRPQRVVLAYTSYQDARNQLSGLQQKYWREALLQSDRPGFAKARMPYVYLENDSLQLAHLPFSDFSSYHPLSYYSALVYRLEQALSNIRYGFTDKHQLTESILRQMARLCRQHETELIVLLLDQAEATEKLLAFCQRENIPVVNAALDMTDPDNNLAPYDSHPNARAHARYAEKLLEFLH